MEDFGQTNNNDLQKAIDEISVGGEGMTPVEPVVNENVQVNLGEPPMPPADGAGMPPMPEMGPAPEMNAPIEPAYAAPEATPAPVSGDLAAVRETALKELVPIIDKAGLSAERQFGILVTVIESSHDKTIVPKALEITRGITDEKARAEALLRLISIIDS